MHSDKEEKMYQQNAKAFFSQFSEGTGCPRELIEANPGQLYLCSPDRAQFDDFLEELIYGRQLEVGLIDPETVLVLSLEEHKTAYDHEVERRRSEFTQQAMQMSDDDYSEYIVQTAHAIVGNVWYWLSQ